jgi:UDP-N-acetylmuramoyl-L-alanyl-D-glutamate--2,6-diaminopimelate ligase
MAEQYQYSGMRVLGDLLPGVASEIAAVPVEGLKLDSRDVQPGDVFLALKGHCADGRNYIDSAVRSGAVAVIADAPCASDNWSLPVIEIENLGEQLSAIAGRFYSQPSKALSLVGITGTNGKTSCSWMLAQLLEILGSPCGVIGTLGTGRIGQMTDSGNTTPDAVTIQRQLAEWRDGGAKWAAMEVSSHGIVQHRVADLIFSAAVFTNLSRDHLDYHGTMESYGNAKAELFSWAGLPLAVINRDDEFGRKLIAGSSAEKVIDYSLRNRDAAVYMRDLQASIRGSEGTVVSPWGEMQIKTDLIGDFNLANLLANCALLLAKGFAPAEIEGAVSALQPVPGRMQCLRSQDDVLAVVDYAHTDDALRKVLAALRPLTTGQLVCVFGCGGDRDRGKRPLMGAAAAELADRVVVTSDNPRSEQPEHIAADICAGIADGAKMSCELDRAVAIRSAVAAAKPGDIVLVAGKGHEQYQDIAGQRRPFNDVEEVDAALKMRVSAARGEAQ